MLVVIGGTFQLSRAFPAKLMAGRHLREQLRRLCYMIRDDPSKLPRIVACTFWWDGMAAVVWITAIAWRRHSCVQRYGVLRDIFAKRASEFQVNLVDDRKHPLFLEQLIE